ncbi:hypothetical protein ACO1O0_008301 [Amphichorda felina]
MGLATVKDDEEAACAGVASMGLPCQGREYGAEGIRDMETYYSRSGPVVGLGAGSRYGAVDGDAVSYGGFIFADMGNWKKKEEENQKEKKEKKENK